MLPDTFMTGATAMMDYKGFKAQIDIDDEAGIFVGEVINTRDGITFTGRSVEELRGAFERAVEEYLDANTASEGEEPGFSGQLSIRLNPSLHRAVVQCAAREGMSVVGWISRRLGEATGTGRGDAE